MGDNPFRSPRDWRVIAITTAVTSLGVVGAASVVNSAPAPTPVHTIHLTEQRPISATTSTPLAPPTTTDTATTGLDSPFSDPPGEDATSPAVVGPRLVSITIDPVTPVSPTTAETPTTPATPATPTTPDTDELD